MKPLGNPLVGLLGASLVAQDRSSVGEHSESLRDLERFDPKLIVGSTKHWHLAVRSIQITIGSCYIYPKRSVFSFPDLKRREAADLLKMVTQFEKLLKLSFVPCPQKFNYVISGMHDPLLHLHAFPRYKKDDSVTFGGHPWRDHRWPMFLDLQEERKPSAPGVLAALTTYLKEKVAEYDISLTR